MKCFWKGFWFLWSAGFAGYDVHFHKYECATFMGLLAIFWAIRYAKEMDMMNGEKRWSKDSVADGMCDDATGEPFVLPKEWMRNSTLEEL